MYDNHNLDISGTLAYREKWQMFDQIILSYNLLVNDGGYFTGYEGGMVHSSDEIMFTNPETGFRSPNRTFGGSTYYGGVSDHLPVFMNLKKDEPAK
jgi:hypothetical protein